MPPKSKRRPPEKTNGVNKKAKTTTVSSDGVDHVWDSPLSLATVEEKQQWRGWCEIESEPAFFNVMLQDFGVKGVKIQEVLGLDPELLDLLPKPIYGLIFLFRYRDLGEDKQEASCPEHVWFANQTSTNACATVALLNIVNNVPEIASGDILKNFRDFTRNFTPALRGDQMDNFQFIKQVHNSFARKMDMLNIDLALQNGYDDRRKKKKTGLDSDDEEPDSAFHFIALLPIGKEVWKLDGLDRQPQRLGLLDQDDSDWFGIAIPYVRNLMATSSDADGPLEFSLLALVQDPIIDIRSQLAQNIAQLRSIELQLDAAEPNWHSFCTDAPETSNGDGKPTHEVLRAGTPKYRITEEDLAMVTLPATENSNASESTQHLIDKRHKLITTQQSLRAAYREEEEAARADQHRAANRRHDYGPMIHTWLRVLADKEVLRDLVEQVG